MLGRRAVRVETSQVAQEEEDREGEEQELDRGKCDGGVKSDMEKKERGWEDGGESGDGGGGLKGQELGAYLHIRRQGL
jgi:hypothetical protein